MIPILCRVVGHKWFFKKKKEEMVGKRIYQRITHIQVEHCLRCGEPSPSFSSHDQGPERDARIAELSRLLERIERERSIHSDVWSRNITTEIRKALGKGE